MKSLVIGLGIGNLYITVLKQIGATVFTVDQDKNKSPDFTTISDALTQVKQFDTIHICTPNHTHAEIAKQVAPHAKCVFIEKPGVKTADEWRSLCTAYPATRFMMVKNNMWRNQITEMKEAASQSHKVEINWVRKDCIPRPGSWFTTRALSYGGVSRDLMPHLLSMYIAVEPTWASQFPDTMTTQQCWSLADITSTQYGTVVHDGTYDVDDMCQIVIGDKWYITADWRSMDTEYSNVVCHLTNGSTKTFDLGWCPEDAYLNMISEAIASLDNDKFWFAQLEQDLWIHEVIDTLGV